MKRLSHPGFENCFEIAIKSSEGRSKQYVFGAETDASCTRWMEVLSSVINATPPMSSVPKVLSSSTPSTVSGVAKQQAQRTDSVESTVEGETINVLHLASSVNPPVPVPKNTGVGTGGAGSAGGKTMSGYLLKDSPIEGRGFQKRFFVLRSPGVLAYFMKVINCIFDICLIIVLLIGNYPI